MQNSTTLRIIETSSSALPVVFANTTGTPLNTTSVLATPAPVYANNTAAPVYANTTSAPLLANGTGVPYPFANGSAVGSGYASLSGFAAPTGYSRGPYPVANGSDPYNHDGTGYARGSGYAAPTGYSRGPYALANDSDPWHHAGTGYLGASGYAHPTGGYSRGPYQYPNGSAPSSVQASGTGRVESAYYPYPNGSVPYAEQIQSAGRPTGAAGANAFHFTVYPYSDPAPAPTAAAVLNQTMYNTTSNSTTPTWRNATSTATSSTSTCSLTASASPTIGPACYSVPIPGCTRCEGQPGDDEFCGLTIDTNYYEEWPKTCTQVICELTISELIVAPDGVPRLAQVVNGKVPGDLIEANWGDEVQVTVINMLPTNGTSIHFHGIRQWHTAEYDGVTSITQCPIAGGGGSMTYHWTASQYGNSWYHSHYSIQAWEGVLGPLHIHGPTTAPYDIDLGPVVQMDWLHTPIWSIFTEVETGAAPVQDNALINGVNLFGDASAGNESSGAFTGSQAQFVFTPGKRHRLRLVNTAIDSYFAFSIDGHSMTVIGMDFVPIVPYTTNVLKTSTAQRYDIIVEANAEPGDYWMRLDPLYGVFAEGGPTCGSPNLMAGNIRAQVHYEGSCSTPASLPWQHDNICDDEDLGNLVPWLALNAGGAAVSVDEDVVIAPVNGTNIFRWYLSGTTFQAQYSQPTLLDVLQGSPQIGSLGPLAISLPRPQEWVYVIIESPIPMPHPIHLHGHDFYVLGAGQNQQYVDQPLNLYNPPRRDVANMPPAGYLVLGFLTDNPGTWLMHCHIGWHISMGYVLSLLPFLLSLPVLTFLVVLHSSSSS